MQDAEGPAAGTPSANSPADEFRDLVDSTIDAIHPIAEMEVWAHDHSIFNRLAHPGSHGRSSDAFGMHIDEAAAFNLLANTLTTFRNHLDQIPFPDDLRGRVVELQGHTDALVKIARDETRSGGLVPVDTSHSERKHFLQAVNAWQDSVAGIADHLGL